MPTRLIDVQLDAPPAGASPPDGCSTVRALFWWGRFPVGQLTFSALEATPDRLREEGRRRLAAEVEEARRRSASPPLAWPGVVSVAICTHDRTRDLLGCLRALRAQVDAPAHELLVVDNAPSTTETRDALAREPRVRYLQEPLRGQNFARNLAVAEARGDLLAFLDDDTQPCPGWLRAIGEAFAADPDLSACSGPVTPLELETPAQELFEALAGFRQLFTRRAYALSAPADDVNGEHWPAYAGLNASGGNMAFRTHVIRRLGGFDEALDTEGLPGGGDQEAFLRLVEGGGRFAFEPAMLVRHRHHRDLPSLLRQLPAHNRGTMAYLIGSALKGSPHRRQLLGAVWNELSFHAGRLAASLTGKATPLPVGLGVAALRGSAQGLYAYPLSALRARLKRIRALRRRA